METPYVVRSHAASQTHEEQACWTFSHPHPSSLVEAATASENMDTTSDKGDFHGLRSSAKAAENLNNDRHAHLSFRRDPTHGAGIGCGYGALDPEVASMASSSSADPQEGEISTNNNDDTTLTIHGFLGSFHSMLYEKMGNGEEKEDQQQRSSVISIAPNTFSVGMFSWFPLVSAF